jgi:VanZ family protein
MRIGTLSGLLVLSVLVAVTIGLGWGAVSAPGWASGLVLAAWIGVLVGGVWHLLRAASWRQRLMVLGVLVLLLLGMVLPPDWLQQIQQWVFDRFGRAPRVDMSGSAPMLAHIGLYAVFAASLLWARGHRNPVWVLLALAGFAVATELMQLLVDGRNADPMDVVLNFSGIAAGAVIAWIVTRLATSEKTGRTNVKN